MSALTSSQLEQKVAEDYALYEQKEDISDNVAAVYGVDGVGLQTRRKQGVDEEDENAPRESLVEYEEPTFLSTTDDLSEKDKQIEKAKKKAAATAGTLTGKGGKTTQLTDVLNAILPPREYVGPNGEKLAQKVKAEPASRDDVIMLQMKLDERLQQRQARENGICPVREQLYSQCNDELIRQVTIECPERGLLLLRVRDEVRMTIAAYQTLYESSITFGMRKTLQAEQGNAELLKKIEEYENEKKKLAAQVADCRGLYESIEKKYNEQRAAEEKKMQEEKDFLKFQAQHLESFLKSAMQ